MTERNLFIKTYENNKLIMSDNVIGSIQNNLLCYSTDTDTFQIDLINLEMRKENLESIFILNEKKCELILKEISQSVNIPIISCSFLMDKNTFSISYQLESQEQELSIKIIIGDEING